MRFSVSRFRHPWRQDQARILSEFDRHAQDDHFHVVAAPGSGKAILGLEAVRRLDRPALVCRASACPSGSMPRPPRSSMPRCSTARRTAARLAAHGRALGAGAWPRRAPRALARHPQVSRLTRAVIGALGELKAIDTTATPPDVRVDASGDRLGILVDGLSVPDEMVLHEALQQLFCPLFSPRYLIRTLRRTWVVPKALGDNRDNAEAFLRHVRRRVGRARLVYARSAGGKRLPLRAVQRYLAAHLRERPQTGVRWA